MIVYKYRTIRGGNFNDQLQRRFLWKNAWKHY